MITTTIKAMTARMIMGSKVDFSAARMQAFMAVHTLPVKAFAYPEKSSFIVKAGLLAEKNVLGRVSIILNKRLPLSVTNMLEK